MSDGTQQGEEKPAGTVLFMPTLAVWYYLCCSHWIMKCIPLCLTDGNYLLTLMAIEIWMKFSLSTNVSGASQRDRIATFFQTTKTAEEKYETAPYSSSNTIQFSESPEIPN